MKTRIFLGPALILILALLVTLSQTSKVDTATASRGRSATASQQQYDCSNPHPDWLICGDWEGIPPHEDWPCKNDENCDAYAGDTCCSPWQDWIPCCYGHCENSNENIVPCPGERDGQCLRIHKARYQNGVVDLEANYSGEPHLRTYFRFYVYLPSEPYTEGLDRMWQEFIGHNHMLFRSGAGMDFKGRTEPYLGHGNGDDGSGYRWKGNHMYFVIHSYGCHSSLFYIRYIGSQESALMTVEDEIITIKAGPSGSETTLYVVDMTDPSTDTVIEISDFFDDTDDLESKVWNEYWQNWEYPSQFELENIMDVQIKSSDWYKVRSEGTGELGLVENHYGGEDEVPNYAGGDRPFCLDQHEEEWVYVEWMVDVENGRTSLWVAPEGETPVKWIDDYDMSHCDNWMQSNDAVSLKISGFSNQGHWESPQFDYEYHICMDDVVVSTSYIGPRAEPEIPELALHGAPADQAIHLTWTVNTTLPVTSTWRITYDPPDGDQPSPITGITNTTRAHTLTGLTNYTWYTVTLNGMLDSTPFLTDTVTIMPTDIFVYLPLVLRSYSP